MPVWVNESFWTRHADRHADHFVHLSNQNPPLLAYTMDATKGCRDIQTPIKAGRYLAKYFSDVLTAKQIAYMAAWQANGSKPQGEAGEAEVQFATTQEEIVGAYVKGPTSCMDGDNFDEDDSPVRVYAAGDLAIAYLEGEPPNQPDNTVIARCLVWPAKKVMGRVYPTQGNFERDGWRNDEEHMAAHYALESKLKEMGYESVYEGGSFSGAKLLSIRVHGNYVMPYLDNDYGVDDDGYHFIMREEGEGEYTCQETGGYRGGEREDRYEYTCENCNEGNNDGTSAVRTRSGLTDEWCEYCTSNHAFYCTGDEQYYSDNQASVCMNGETYSEAYANDHFYLSDYSNEWFDPASDPSVEMANGDTWSESEFEKHGFSCLLNECRYDKAEMHADHENFHLTATHEEIAAYWAEQKETVE